MNQAIHFCTCPDGARIAYALSGRGTPLVMSGTWLNHLEYQWENLAWRPWLEHFSRGYTLLRYDLRGTGLSDRSFDNTSAETWARDISTVVDAAGFTRFPLLGICQGGPIAISYAARHPERVSHLLLYGTYARGNFMRPERPREAQAAQVFVDLARLGWGAENQEFMQVWANVFQPGGGLEHVRTWTELQRRSVSAENAAAFFEAAFRTDVQEDAGRVRCLTLVVHANKDKAVHVEEGRRLASLIPGARFVELDSPNHMLLPEEPAWARFLDEARSFLGRPSVQDNIAGKLPTLTGRERQVLEGIARGLDNAEIATELALSEKTVRNHVTRVFDKIGVAHRYQAIVLARDAGLADGGRTRLP
ncbi:MAG TPA: alpha/beta fold hydrolase [Burkholderiaceae bacterium]|nr:alpha/beta fold hydrolase [Burkholderiaceae bacterium]